MYGLEGLRLVRAGITEGICFGFLTRSSDLLLFGTVALVGIMDSWLVCPKTGERECRLHGVVKTYETWGVEICRLCCAFLCASWNKAHRDTLRRPADRGN